VRDRLRFAVPAEGYRPEQSASMNRKDWSLHGETRRHRSHSVGDVLPARRCSMPPSGAVPVLSRCCQRPLRVTICLLIPASSPRDGYVEAPARQPTFGLVCPDAAVTVRTSRPLLRVNSDTAAAPSASSRCSVISSRLTLAVAQ
jgi:hypothetical protein